MAILLNLVKSLFKIIIALILKKKKKKKKKKGQHGAGRGSMAQRNEGMARRHAKNA